MTSRFVSRLTGLALSALVAAPLAAQQPPAELSRLSTEEIRQSLLIGGVAFSLPASQPFFRGAPGTSSGSPSGFGAAWRDGFVGGGVQQTRGGGRSDGALAGGFGLGNARDAVGLEVVIASLSTFRSGLFDRTAFSFKAHHMVSNSASVALGIENAFIAGGGKTDGTTSLFVAATQVLSFPQSLFKQVTLSGGVGNGRFRFEKDVIAKREMVNFFGSAGVQLLQQASVFADWGGQDLAVGLSLVPVKAFPLILTPTIADVTRQNGNNPRATLGFGIGMRF